MHLNRYMIRMLMGATMLLIFLSLGLHGQNAPRTSTHFSKGTLLLSCDFGGSGLTAYDNVTGGKTQVFRQLQFDPKIGYMPADFLCLGAAATIGSYAQDGLPTVHYRGLGGYARFYPWAKARQKVLNGEALHLFGKPLLGKLDTRERRILGGHIFPFLETGYTRFNMRATPAGPFLSSTLFEPRIHFAAGMDFRIWGPICFQFAFIQSIFPSNPAQQRPPLGVRGGLELAIPTRKTQQP